MAYYSKIKGMKLSWENSRHFETPLLPNATPPMTTVKIPYWSRVTTQIWVVLNLALKVLSGPWLRLVTRFPKAGSQKWGRGRRVNNCHCEKSYSVGAREEFAASFHYQLMARVFENVNNTRKIVLYNVRERTLVTRLVIHLVYCACTSR